MWTFWLRFILFVLVDRPWPSSSNLTLFPSSVYMHCFGIFEIFVRCAKMESVPHPIWLHTICLLTALRHGPWNSLVVYLVRPSLAFGSSHSPYRSMCQGDFSQPLTQRSALDFISCYQFSPKYMHFKCQNFIYQHSAITETTVKRHSFAFILLNLQHWDCWLQFQQLFWIPGLFL